MENDQGWQLVETKAKSGEMVELELSRRIQISDDKGRISYRFERIIMPGMALPRKQWAVLDGEIFVSPHELNTRVLRWRYP